VSTAEETTRRKVVDRSDIIVPPRVPVSELGYENGKDGCNATSLARLAVTPNVKAK